MKHHRSLIRSTTFLRAAMAGSALALACASSGASASENTCWTEKIGSDGFSVCRYDMSSVSIELMRTDKDGRPLGSMARAARHIRSLDRTPALITNGGMYHDDLSPVGYYVENRRKLQNANTRRGPGNFHMMPNGIFYVERGRAGVMETRAFLKRNRRPAFATQSGPMLVVKGRIHPRFNPQSVSRKSRNGVGVSADGRTVYFAITNGAATFHAFARLFHEVLKTPNALFLDGGSVPQMWASDGVNRLNFAPVGPVIAVMSRPKNGRDKSRAR